MLFEKALADFLVYYVCSINYSGGEGWLDHRTVNVWHDDPLLFMKEQSVDSITAVGVMGRSDIEATAYPRMVYELSKKRGTNKELTMVI